MTPPERQVFEQLALYGIRFEQEFPLGGFFFDFAVPLFRMLIEVDSYTYHRHPSRRHRDREKTAIAERDGWKVARVSNPDIAAKVAKAFLDREHEVTGAMGDESEV